MTMPMRRSKLLKVAAALGVVDGAHGREPSDASEFVIHFRELGAPANGVDRVGRHEPWAQALREEVARELRERDAQLLCGRE